MKGFADKRTRGLAMLILIAFISRMLWQCQSDLVIKCCSPPLSPDDEIKLVLNNPGKEELFIPVDWEGIDIFRMDGDGKWFEYRKAGSPMFSTTRNRRLLYSCEHLGARI